VPDLQLSIANQIATSASQMSLSIQELITTMKASGMADSAIKQTLINDLNSGGALFGSFRNKLKNTVRNGVELSSNGRSNSTFTKAGVQGFQWISVGDGKVCPDCEERHGETGTMEFFETIGLPASGFSVCTTNCRCQLVPESYKGENLDKPLVKPKRVPLRVTDFKMAGKHKTAKDSLAWMKSNIADKVQLNQIKDVSVLNQITTSLKNNYTKYNLKRLDSIKFQRGRAWASANGGELNINQKIFTKIGLDKAYKHSVTEYGVPWKKHLTLMKEKFKIASKNNDYSAIPFYKREINKAEKRIAAMGNYKRFNALDKNNIAKSIIDHELGHVIHDQFTGKISGRWFLKNKNISDEIRNKWNMEWISIYRKAKRDGLIESVSEYASKNHYELFAESFAMYSRGDKLPELIKDYLDRYLKTTDFD